MRIVFMWRCRAHSLMSQPKAASVKLIQVLGRNSPPICGEEEGEEEPR